MASTNDKQKIHPTSSVIAPNYTNMPEDEGAEPPENITLEHIQRLENDLAVKDQEIQVLPLLANMM